MSPIRSPKGLALTVLATLFSWVGSRSVLGAYQTWTLAFEGAWPLPTAYWLGGPIVLVALLGLAIGIWALLALASYAVRLDGVRLVLAAALMGGGLVWAYWVFPWDLPLNRSYDSATLGGAAPEGLASTRWRGIAAVCGMSWAIHEIDIDADGGVTYRQWDEVSSTSLLPLLHLFRASPPTAPTYTEAGRHVGDTVVWQDGDISRLDRRGNRLSVEWPYPSRV